MCKVQTAQCHRKSLTSPSKGDRYPTLAGKPKLFFVHVSEEGRGGGGGVKRGGKESCVCGTDGRVSLVLTSSLNGDRCLTLVGKPKLFFAGPCTQTHSISQDHPLLETRTTP